MYICSMDAPKIIVRAARLDDAAVIAHAVAKAIGDEAALQAYCGDDYLAVLTEVARREGTFAEFYEKAFAECHERICLIVDSDNPNAERLYTSLGFKRVGTCLFFGHQMWYLQKRK